MQMEVVRHLQELVKTFNWHSPSWDLFIFAAWIAVSVIYSFAAGRGRVMAVLISIYIAKLLTSEIPWLSAELGKHVKGNLLSFEQLIVFGIIFLILFFFLSKYAFRSSVYGRHLGAIIFTTTFALLQMGLLINLILGFLPSKMQESFSPLVQFVFVNPTAHFVWLLAPIVFLVVLGRLVTDRAEI
jgi:MFS family permease